MNKQLYFLTLIGLLSGIQSAAAHGLTKPTDPASRPVAAAQQSARADRLITGTVTDDKGEQLPGVSVTLKGTQRGTTTDATGQYKLNLTDGAGSSNTLVFSYVGYLSQEKPLGNSDVVNITLLADTRALDEVVVVGYGTQRKSDLTGSVVSINKERLQQLPNTNIAQALQGSIPGLQINTNSGGAEQNNVTILVRGRSSISANTSPLIILDGIPYTGSISDINPSDVGSIEVLKDASAAAIYGSRGSNGVILVTTKQGKSGQVRISYDGFYGIQQIAHKPDLLNGPDFYDFKKNRANIPAGSISPSEQAVYDSGNFADWYALATRQGTRNQQSINVSGGSEKAQFYIGGTYLNVAGIARNDNFKRYTLRPNLNVQITPWLNFASSSQLSYADRSGVAADFAGEQGANFFIPLATPYNPDGTPTIYAWPEYNLAGNPLQGFSARDVNRTYRTFSTNAIRVDIPFVKGLSYKLNTGVELQSSYQETYYGRDTRTGFEGRGVATNITSQGRNFTIEHIVNYGREFGKHNLGITGLYSTQSTDNTSQTLQGKGFPNDVLTNYQMNTATLLTPSASYSKQNLQSQMLRVNYGYDSRYLLTLTARRDGYSGFGSDTKYGIFPSVALGWNIAREAFMTGTNFVTLLKLRASYGLNGNQAVDSYQSLATLSTRQYLDGSTIIPGYIPSRLGNNDLGWESTRSSNVGLDFGFLGNRIQGSIDLYQKQTYDLLLRRNISSVQGFPSIVQNVGKTDNKGVEVLVTSTNINRNGLTWVTSANGAYNVNRIVDLYGDGSNDPTNGWFLGRPIRTIFDYQYGGIFRSADEVASSPQPTAKPGYVRVADVNGDDKINGDDRTFQGNLDPRFTYGLTNTVTYKGLSLMVFIQGVGNVTKEDPLQQDAVFTDVRRNTTKKDWWTPDNPNAAHWSNDANSNNLNINIYQNASFARLKDVSLAYQLPASVLKSFRMSTLKVYLTGRNLATITSYTGLDPELTNQVGLPLQREFLVGLNASF